jgi:hypothetical protein
MRGVLAGVCCTAVMVMCNEVSGVKIDTIHISELEQFLQIAPEQAKTVKSISFENQSVDEDFCLCWSNIFIGHEFDSVKFEHCCFLNDDFYILDGLVATNLAVVNCDIKAEDTIEIFRGINPYAIKYINISFNKLGENEELLNQALQKYIYGQCVITLDLRGNNLSSQFRNSVLDSTVKFVFDSGE